MRAERPVRIPLQTGTTALHGIARAAAFFVPGIALVGVPATALFEVGDLLEALGDVGGWIATAILTPGLMLLAFAWKHGRRARAARPSDIVLDAEGFTITGGPLSGERFTWSAIARVTMESPPARDPRDGELIDDSDLKQLCIYVRDGRKERRLILASADRAIEQRSLEALADTLRAGLPAPPEAAEKEPKTAKRKAKQRPKAEIREPKGDGAVALLTCPSCGAAVAPRAESEVPCVYCSASVTIPDEMRRRLEDAAAVLARPDAAIAKLLDQPGAEFVGRLYVFAAVFMVAAWPAAVLLLARNYRERALTVSNTLLVAVFLVACIVGFFALIRGRLVDRLALRLVTLEFAAHAPAKKGEPFLCRSCIAPLPEQGDHVLVSCVYCKAENVLCLDLRREADAARRESRSLEDALALRNAERRRWRGVTTASLVVIAIAALSFRHAIGRNPKTWPLEQSCNDGDLRACVKLADLVGLKPAEGVRPDRKRAAALYERACDANDAHACEAGADLYADLLASPVEDGHPRAHALRLRACELGSASACRAVAEQLNTGDFLAHVKKDAARASQLRRRACELGDTRACEQGVDR
jgi:hypothetical protein